MPNLYDSSKIMLRTGNIYSLSAQDNREDVAQEMRHREVLYGRTVVTPSNNESTVGDN